VEEELRQPKPRIYAKGIKQFEINGPLYACPLRSEGQTAAVLVTWSRTRSNRSAAKRKASELDLFSTGFERVLRVANLLANDISHGADSDGAAEALIEEMNRRLAEVDGGEMWNKEFLLRLRDPGFRKQVLGTLMKSLLHSSTGLTRIRVWRRIASASPAQYSASPRPLAFYCVGSLSSEAARNPGVSERDHFTGCVAYADDPYCDYVIKRSVHDKTARLQHPEMFGNLDSHWDVLERAPGASWMVAPLLQKDKLVGALAADSHIWTAGALAERPVRDKQRTFQLRAVDLVADVARFVVQFWSDTPPPDHLRMTRREPAL
jgi:hypothetical protein